MPKPLPQWTFTSKQERAGLILSNLAGALAVVLTSLLFALSIMLGFSLLPERSLSADQPRAKEIKVAWDPPPSPVEKKYMEANQTVPENKPDETRNYSFKNQQAAQDNPDPTSSAEMPEIDGEIEDSQKIIESTLSQQPSSILPAGVPNPSQSQSGQDTVAMASPRPPAPDFIKQDEPEQTEGIESTELDPQQGETETKEPAKKIITVTAPGRSEVEVVMEKVAVDEQNLPEGVPIPQARPRLQINAPPAPLAKTKGRASRLGVIATDAEYSDMGVYGQSMLEAISAQWNQLGSTFDYSARDIGTQVQIQAYLEKDGYLSDFKVVESTASRQATLLVENAVLSRVPFGEWTAQMIKELPERKEINITFHYR